MSTDTTISVRYFIKVSGEVCDQHYYLLFMWIVSIYVFSLQYLNQYPYYNV